MRQKFIYYDSDGFKIIIEADNQEQANEKFERLFKKPKK